MDKNLRRKELRIKSLQKLLPETKNQKQLELKSKFLDSPQKPSRSKLAQIKTSRALTKTKQVSLEPLPPEPIRIIKKSILRSKRNLSVEGIFDENNQEIEVNRIKRNSSLVDNYKIEKTWDNNELPYTPAEVLQNYHRYLTPYEKNEILAFKKIYYIAPGVVKLETNPRLSNQGLDDDRNDLILVKNDHIVYRFEILEIIGRGSYGQVIKAYDHKEKKLVAVKIIRNMACIIQQAKIEIQVLYRLIKQIDQCENVIHIQENFIFRNHIIETFELLETNLYQHIKSKGFQGLPLHTIKVFAQQILQGMKFYDSLSILHCDLKPENIMLTNDNTKAIIIDFGSACFTHKRVFTYIQSRYYRAPEVILEIGYDSKIDIWSFGCVLGELATGRPIFAGKNEIDQFLSIVEVLGLPPSDMLEASSKCEAIIEQFKKISNSGNSLKSRIPGSKSLKSILPNGDILFLDFLMSNFYLECLAWNPNDRFSPSEALEHDWFKTTLLNRQGSLPDLRWETLLKPVKNSVKKVVDGSQTHKSNKSKFFFTKS